MRHERLPGEYYDRDNVTNGCVNYAMDDEMVEADRVAVGAV
jgi:hypothetical protein